MVPFVVMFSLNAAILSIWTVVDPIVWTREYLGDYDVGSTGGRGDHTSTGFCNVFESPFSLACTVLLLAINFFALVLALFQLYEARELATEYSEGKYIAIAIGSMIQAFITGLPILLLARHNMQAYYFAENTIRFVVCMSLLLLMFLPKYYIAKTEEQQSKSAHTRDDSIPDGAPPEWKSEASMLQSGGTEMDHQVVGKASPSHSPGVAKGDFDLVDLQTQNIAKYNITGTEERNFWKKISLEPPRTEDSQLISCVSEMTDSLFPISEYEVALDVEYGARGTTPNGDESKEQPQSPFWVYENESSHHSPDGSPQIPIRISSTVEDITISTPTPTTATLDSGNHDNEEELQPPKLLTRSAFSASLGRQASTRSEDCPPRPPRRITSTMDDDAFDELE